MYQQKMTAPVLAHRDGHKNAGSKSTKTRTTILLAAAKVCNWLVGEIGLCLCRSTIDFGQLNKKG